MTTRNRQFECPKQNIQAREIQQIIKNAIKYRKKLTDVSPVNDNGKTNFLPFLLA
jgi:hypothetical protein